MRFDKPLLYKHCAIAQVTTTEPRLHKYNHTVLSNIEIIDIKVKCIYESDGASR